MDFNSNKMNKLGFTDILKQGATLVPGKIIEDRNEFQQFITTTKKKQEDVLKLKDLNNQQLKITIKL